MDSLGKALAKVIESEQFGRFIERLVAIIIAAIAVKLVGVEFGQLVSLLIG